MTKPVRILVTPLLSFAGYSFSAEFEGHPETRTEHIGVESMAVAMLVINHGNKVGIDIARQVPTSALQS